MHPNLQLALDHADHARLDLLAALDLVPPDVAATRPSPDAWSAAEVVEHLAQVEGSVVKLLARRADEFRAMSPVPAESPDCPALDLARFAPVLNRTRRLDAPERVRPTGTMPLDVCRNAVLEVRRTMIEQVHAADGLPLSQVVHPHPFFGPMNLYEWLYLIGSHEMRHAAQVREIAAQFSETVH